MAKTTPQMSIHEIRLGKSKRNGEANIVAPGKPFDCPGDELDFLQDAGACRNLTEDEAARYSGGSKKAAKAETGDEPDEAEKARLALIQEAKDLGVKGVRKDWSAEKTQTMIDEFKAAQDEDGDQDDGDEDVVW